MPPNAGRATSGHRKSRQSRRLDGSIRARSLRIGSARNQTKPASSDFPVLREFEPFEARRRRQLRSQARLLGFERAHESLVHRQRPGRAVMRLRASSPSTARTAGLGSARYATSTGLAIATPAIETSAAATGDSPRGNERCAPDRQERDDRHERQRSNATNDVSWNSKWNTTIRDRASAMTAASERRSRQPSCTTPAAARTDHGAEHGRVPWMHERPQQRERQRARAGIRVEHLAAKRNPRRPACRARRDRH